MAQTQKTQKQKVASAPKAARLPPTAGGLCGETTLGEADAYRLAGLLASPPAPSAGLVAAAALYRDAFPA